MLRRRNTVVVSAFALVVGASALVANAGNETRPAGAEQGARARGVPSGCRDDASAGRSRIDEAKLIIEYNFTDGDIGVHGGFDHDGWKVLCVFAPSGRPVLVVGPKNQMRDLAMAGIFFESREPELGELSIAELLTMFPEGRYRVRGLTFDGESLVGSALFTHDIPAAPDITAPQIYPGPRRAERNPVSRTGLVVHWDPVTQTIEGDPVEITGYEVIVTKEEHDDPHGFSRPIYDVHVPPSVRSLPVVWRFLEAGTVYEVEVLALEKSGNQTIGLGFFATN